MSDATYTVTEDYYEPMSDGSGKRLIFKAGTVISQETADALGLARTKKADEKPAKKA